jgi:hypothetical protein
LFIATISSAATIWRIRASLRSSAKVFRADVFLLQHADTSRRRNADVAPANVVDLEAVHRQSG